MSEEKKQKSDEIKEFGALMLNENKKNTKKPTHIGVFNTPEEAFLAYKTEKEKYIKEVANYYKEKYDNFPIVAYNALCDYKVEITD